MKGYSIVSETYMSMGNNGIAMISTLTREDMYNLE
jgi:hypothetical protein